MDVQLLLTNRKYLSILLANAITHFDNALYGYLVPIIAPIWFPDQTVLIQLMLGYGLLIGSCLVKPLGVLISSKLASRNKEVAILRYTLFGLGLGLMVMGLLPVQHAWSIYGLWLARLFIEACSAGEQAIAKLYILKSTDSIMAKQYSVWYEISTILGIILAGSIGTWFACVPALSYYWQIPFIIAGLMTWFNLLCFRTVTDQQTAPYLYPIAFFKSQSLYAQIVKERYAIMRIAIVSGFSYVTYVITFIWLNSFMPLVSTISYKVMMQYNMVLLWSDLVLLGLIGKICKKYDHNNLMAFASGLVALWVIPLFSRLPDASLSYVLFMRYGLLCCGVVFCCFLTLWAKQQLIDPDHAYVTIGFASVLGSSLLGKSATTICFYLYHYCKSPIAPACYIAILAFIAMLIMADSICYE